MRGERIIIREFACLTFVADRLVLARCAHRNALMHVLAVHNCPQKNFAVPGWRPGAGGGVLVVAVVN